MLRPEEKTALQDADGALIAVGDDGFIAFATPAALALVGWDETLVGRPLQTIVPPRLRQRHAKGFRDYVVSRRPKLHYPAREPALGLDGKEREVEIVVAAFRRPDGSMFMCSALGPVGGPVPNVGHLESALRDVGYQRLKA